MKSEDKNMILDSYLAKVSPIPTLPETAVRILDMSANPEVDIEEVADAIMKDKVLTARMIRLVNSAFWGLRRKIASVREAIVYLGMHQIRSIVLTTSLFNTFHSNNSSFNITSIWEHGLGCAMISRLIAKMTGVIDEEKAYLAGLMHDIGEVILSQFSVDEFDDVVQLVKREKIGFYEAENQVLGISHTDFGEYFQVHWGFAEDLAEVIMTHHSLEDAKINPTLVSIVVLANLLCKVRGLDYGYAEPIQVAFKDERAWEIIAQQNPKLNGIDLERFTLDLDGKITDIRKVVKETYSGIESAGDEDLTLNE